MHIKFLPHSTGRGQRAIEYLLGREDHKGEVRAGVEVLRGNPKLTGQLIDSLETVHRYTSGVIAFSPEDAPTPVEIERVLNEFERVAFAGLERNQYDFCVVQHRESDGGVHLHIVSPRVELTTGRALNIAPPKWKYTFDPLRDALNHEHGWARPDDPSRARLVQQGKAKPVWKAGQDHRTVITEYMSELIANGQVTNRADVVAALAELGEVTRAGADYVSLKLEGAQKAVRLKGLIYDEKFSGSTLRKVASEAASRPPGRGRPDAEAARLARVELERSVSKRFAYNKERYQKAAQRDGAAVALADAVAHAGHGPSVSADAVQLSRLQLVDSQPGGRPGPAETTADQAGRGGVLRDAGRPEGLQNTTQEPVNDRVRELADRAIEQAQRAARRTADAAARAAGATSRAAAAIVETCRKIDRAMPAAVRVFQALQDSELERFKREINLVEFAQSLGYEVLKKESSRASIVMKSGGDKIIVATDQADGHGIYFSVGDESDCGSVIDFAQKRIGGNLGQVRKELRGWMPEAARPSPRRKALQERPERPQAVTRDRAQLLARFAALTPYSGRYLTATRKVDQAVIEAFGVRQDGYGNACFVHRDAQGVSGWETKNKGFTGFSEGGNRGLFLARPDDASVTRIVVAEASIDLMSWAQFKHTPGTAYISTGGSVSAEQFEQLRAAFARNPTAEIVLAHDGDAPGDKMADQVRQLAPAGTKVTRDRPPEDMDWNEVLKQAAELAEQRERGQDMQM